jgi:NAD(P)H-nitrite reductase large subunit
MLQYVIIGAGPAGISAAEGIRTRDTLGKILIISDEPEGYYSRPGLAYLLTGEIPEKHLRPFSQADFNRLNVHLIYGRVVQLNLEGRQVKLEDNPAVPYDRLLIATGSQSARLTVPGSDAEGLVVLDKLSDVHAILKIVKKAKSAAVIGGGIMALELVEGLVALGLKPHYFLRGNRYWGNVLDETESNIVEQRLVEDGVQIHYKTELNAILKKSGKVVGVLSNEGRSYPCDILGIAIGVQPRKALAESAGIRTERGILVDEYLQTSATDVYAAGDVAQVYDPLIGKAVLNSLWNPAREQGWVAGLNMAAQQEQRYPYLKSPPQNVARLAHLTTTIIGTVGKDRDDDLVGIGRGESEAWRNMVDPVLVQDHAGTNRVRLLVGPQTLKGAVVMGDQALSRPLQYLVSRQIDITAIRENLLLPDAPIAQLITELWKSSIKTKNHVPKKS